MVERGEARSIGDAGQIILDEAIDVDGGDGIAELDASNEHEHQNHHRVIDRRQHFRLPRFIRHRRRVGLRSVRVLEEQ